jgi:hypothetical protein
MCYLFHKGLPTWPSIQLKLHSPLCYSQRTGGGKGAYVLVQISVVAEQNPKGHRKVGTKVRIFPLLLNLLYQRVLLLRFSGFASLPLRLLVVNVFKHSLLNFGFTPRVPYDKLLPLSFSLHSQATASKYRTGFPTNPFLQTHPWVVGHRGIRALDARGGQKALVRWSSSSRGSGFRGP